MVGPNLNNLRTGERKRRTCYGCGKRRLAAKLITPENSFIGKEIYFCSECFKVRDELVKNTKK